MTIIVSIIALLGAVFVLDGVELPQQTRVWREFTNAGHAILFGVVAVVLLLLSRALFVRRNWKPVAHYWVALGGALILGLATEIGQIIGPRDASLGDMLNNALGAGAFLLFAATLDQSLRDRLINRRLVSRNTVRVLALLLLAFAYLPFTILVLAHSRRQAQFPMISDFESFLDRRFAYGEDARLELVAPPPLWLSNTSCKVGKLTLLPGRISGLAIHYPFPVWTGYTFFAVEIYLEGSSGLTVNLRVDDTMHNFEHDDRFNRRIDLLPGLNRIQIPLSEIEFAPVSRRMEMNSIANIILFVSEIEAPAVIFVDDVRLE